MFVILNGYLFWGIMAVFFIASWVYFARANFSTNQYGSAWGLFLCRNSFGSWIKFLCFVFLISFVVLVFMYNKKDMTWNDIPFKAVVIADMVCAVLLVIFMSMSYCKWCWGEKPLGRITLWTLLVCIPAGVYLLLQNPAIPEGAIFSAFKSAIKFKLNEDVMSIFKEVGIYRLSTYNDMLNNLQGNRIVIMFFVINCFVHLFLCNSWMHFSKVYHRIFYPLVVCVHTFLLIPAAIALGFFGGAFFICAFLYLVYLIAGLFILCLLWIFVSACWTQYFGTGGRGRLSDGTKIRQELGDQWVDEYGNRWTNTGGDEFTRN